MTSDNPETPGTIRVLVAEDSDVNRELVSIYLEKRGYQVEAVENGQQAVDKAAHQDFNLIIMDLQMPEMDGYTATTQIRERESKSAKHTPIIALTAHGVREYRERCFQVGIDDFLLKPVRSADFYRVIDKFLKG